MNLDPMPTDRNFLVKEEIMHYNFIYNQYMPDGTRWVEAHIVNGKVEQWCGNPTTRSIPGIYKVLDWAELPNV